jgi:hypothetical protein
MDYGGVKPHHPDMLWIKYLNGKKVFSGNHGEWGFLRWCLLFRTTPDKHQTQGCE